MPENLWFAIHRGVNLESAEWHQRLIEDVNETGFKLIVFDPIRRFSINADKGPAEVRAITAYLRRLCNETGVTILIVHHDVKPPSQGQDNRRRGHRASGGDWFAAAECPISFESAGETQTVAYPEAFKLSSDPEPWMMRLQTDDPRNPTTARLIGETQASAEAATIAIDQAVLTYLAGEPGASGRTITRALRKGAGVVGQSLDRLFIAGKVDCVEGAKRAKLWSVRASAPSAPNARSTT